MATTQNTYTGNNSTTDYSFTFPYIKEADVKVSLDAVVKTQDTDYTFANATTISFGTAPGTGVAIRIFRDTDLENAVTTFFAGSAIRAEDLNDNTNQVLFSAQERKNRDADKTGDTFTGDIVVDDSNLVIQEGSDAVTITAPTLTANRTLSIPDTTGTIVTTGDNGTVTSTMITDGTIVNADINASAEIAVSKLANGSARQVLQTSANGNDVEFTDNVDLPGTLDVTGAVTFDGSVTAGTFTGNLTGNAGTSTTLQTARNIGGVSFDGSANIDLPGVTTAGNQDTSGNAATATALETARTIAGQSFDGTGNITIAPTDLTGVNADANEINQLDGIDLIPTSPTWTSTTEIPSNAQITDRIAELGGFEAIATEDDFPATAPPEGVVVSIGNANALSVNASGVGSGTRAGGSDAVVINGFPSEFNSTTLDNGIGLVVVATATAHTYDFHRVLAKNEDVRQLSSDMDDFKARYRVGGTTPSDGLCSLDGTGTGSRPCNGDLFYNTGSNTLLVYDARGNTTDTDEAVQQLFTEVQSVGEYFIIPATELADFADGSASTEVISNAPSNAEQIILSINGVIQEPNAGTAVPTDGFSLNGSTIQLAATPPNPSEVWGVIIGSTVNVNEPSANSVSTDKIQDDAVEYDKIQNIATANRVLGSTTAGGVVSEVQVQTDMIADDAVTYAKMQHTANANRVLGAASAGAIGETQVNEAMLNVTNAPTTGQFLQCNNVSGGTGDLTWADATTATPTLDTVTDEGASTTNDISVGGLGIGTTSPGADLHIQGSTVPELRLGRGGVPTSNQTLGQIHIGGFTSGTSYSSGIEIIGRATSGWNAGNCESNIMIRTCGLNSTSPRDTLSLSENGVISMTVNESDGDHFSINPAGLAQDGRSALLVAGSNGGTRVAIKRITGGNSNVSYLECRRSNNGISSISIDSAGTVRVSGTGDIDDGTSYGTVVGSQSSDQRLKNSITDYTGGLSLVNSLRPVNYKYNDTDQVHAGFIAQEVQSVIPEAVYDTGMKPDVYGEEDGRKVIIGQDADADNLLAMHYVEIIPALVNSIKELKAEVDTLKTKVAVLEAK